MIFCLLCRWCICNPTWITSVLNRVTTCKFSHGLVVSYLIRTVLIYYSWFDLCHFYTVKCIFINDCFPSSRQQDYSSVFICTNMFKVSCFRDCRVYWLILFFYRWCRIHVFHELWKQPFKQLHLSLWTLDSWTTT